MSASENQFPITRIGLIKGRRSGLQKLFGFLALLAFWLGNRPAQAQYTANYQTNTISAATNNWAGNYYVGSNTFANGLLIRNGGVLSNADAQVGCMLTSGSNYVMVSGAGSVWSNANLYLGYSAGANTLVVSNAGRVQNSQLTFIANDATSSSNRILVTGTNSALISPYDLRLGYSGFGNSMVISNAGRVVNATGYLGDNIGSSSNSVLVTGAGSVWTNTGSLLAGNHGDNNKLTINKGGRVVSSSATVGLWDTANANSIVVSDAGSLWDDSTEASTMVLGLFGTGNSLVVTNGGQVLGYYFYLGRLYSASNSVLVTGPGSSFSVNCYIFTGNQGHDNLFTAANGAAISDKFCYISYEASSSNNTVVLTGTNTLWQNSYSVFVGFDGSGGGLTISNGATMAVAQQGVLGFDATSGNNHALVTGGGSVWNCTQNFYVGSSGPANSLVISNGGKIINSSSVLGLNHGSDSNSVVVTGASSLWTNYSELYVGYHTAGNSLVVSNGGRIIDFTGYMAEDSGSSNNQALVTGAGSTWTNANALLVGDLGSGNSLTIRDSGLVVDQWGIIGEQASSSNNTVRVESGGIWRNQSLTVGDLGTHNALFVDGGSVFATNMMVGYDPAYCDNFVQLNTGQVIVTNQTSSAVLEIYGGALLLAGGTLRVDTLIVTNPCAQFMHVGGALIYKSLQLNPDADADGDGIPNGWELAHGLDPFNPLDAAADNDGDGMSNLQEYLAGTNPTNRASSFRITSQVAVGGNVRVSWSAVGGKSYIVQSSTNQGANFTDLSPMITVPGLVETSTNYLHIGAATNGFSRYYRIRLAP
jgi:fibronectin-binding autotransporter adhesin